MCRQRHVQAEASRSTWEWRTLRHRTFRENFLSEKSIFFVTEESWSCILDPIVSRQYIVLYICNFCSRQASFSLLLACCYCYCSSKIDVLAILTSSTPYHPISKPVLYLESSWTYCCKRFVSDLRLVFIGIQSVCLLRVPFNWNCCTLRS